MHIFLSFWILPIIFILHDFEEMIFMPPWKVKHHEVISNMKRPFFGNVTNGQAFSVGVLEEVLILIMISIICEISANYILYESFLITYIIHFIKHFSMCISMKGYVPGVVSALLEFPFVTWLIFSYWSLSQTFVLNILYTLIPVFLLMYINLKIMHKLMPLLQKKLLLYVKS